MHRILVVEDHQKLLNSVRRGLELLGYEVLTAETGEEGYVIALNGNIDMMVLDLMLPGKNGFEILTDLRTKGFSKPVLILTSRDSPEDRSRARECGSDGYLIKPFPFADLVASVKKLLAQAAADATPPREAPCAD